MLATALTLPISQYYCITTATVSGIYSKCAYSSNSKLQHRSLVMVQPSGSQTFMNRGPLLSLTSEYLNDTLNIVTLGLWKITAKLPSEGLCSWPPENHSVAPRGATRFEKPWSSHYSCSWAF